MNLNKEIHPNLLVIFFQVVVFIALILLSYINHLEFPVDTTPVPHVVKQECYDIKSLGNETKAQFSAFTLSEDETDANPCVGAGNHNLCEAQERGECVLATWRHPLHTRLLVDGLGECEVLDRTNIKYAGRIDLLKKTKGEAKEFGLKNLSYWLIK